MVDKEMLEAISDMMDDKLSGIKEDVSGLKEDVSILKEDVSGLKEDVSILKEDVSGLKEDVSILKEDVSGLKEDVNIMKEDIVRLYDNMDVMQKDIKKLQITQENQIMPVLSDLVVCYKDTYDRYRAGIEEHDKMRMDIDVIKIVLGEHDQVIKKIS